MGGVELRHRDDVLPCAMERKFLFTFKSILNNFSVTAYSLLSWFGAIFIELCLSEQNDPFRVILPSMRVKNVSLSTTLFWYKPVADRCSLGAK